MGLRALTLTPPQNGIFTNTGCASKVSRCTSVVPSRSLKKSFVVSAKKEKSDEEPVQRKQSLFSSVTEALDFSQVRSVKDAELLEDAREATRSGGRMSREQVIF